MNNNNNNSNQNWFDKFIKLLTALGGGAGIVALITGFVSLIVFMLNPFREPELPKTPPGPIGHEIENGNNNGSTNIPEENTQKKENSSTEKKIDIEWIDLPEDKIDIEWKDLPKFFKINKVKVKKGFQKAPYEISFLLKAKGEFKGFIYAEARDKDNIKICVPDRLELTYCRNYSFFLDFYNKSFGYEWIKDEVDRALLIVPYNTEKIKFIFEQNTDF